MFKFGRLKFLKSLEILQDENPILKKHYPVMHREILERVKQFKKKTNKDNIDMVDCTVGTGAHSQILLEHVKNIKILGLDIDERMIKILPQNIIAKQDNFINFYKHKPLSDSRYFDIIFADLGYNINQVYDESYGLSYKKNSILDMRYSQSMQYTAADLLNNRTQQELREIFHIYGNIYKANQLAKNIVDNRQKQKFERANQIIEILNQLSMSDQIMKTFQALRIAVNQEILNLNLFLEKVQNQQIIDNQLVLIITFHSLEAEAVQKFIMKYKKQFTMKIIKPADDEIEENPRSRSALLFEIINKSV
ncbi:unnamed protein product [Paramecium sonneborni]|uniref:Ribosomal RNA small subunit methyltransferase H n=1 Tax=Paramecium sonneborni TaxID=65129 RepID=A0A8S1MZ77_9CILI|nr:unnamed protein product [Paramecium sonneborni]